MVDEARGRGMVGIARRRGIVHFDAEVPEHKASTLAARQRSGLPMYQRRAGDVVHLSMDLLQLPG